VQTAALMVIRERRVTSEAIQAHGGCGFTEEPRSPASTAAPATAPWAAARPKPWKTWSAAVSWPA